MAFGTVAGLRATVSEAEWAARVDLAAAYRLVALFGWDDLIFTHLTARVPGPEHHFLINPYGMLFEEISASSLVKIDIDGTKVMDSPHEINPAGFLIHSCIHAARENARCVMHLHTAAGVAVSCQKSGLLPVSQPALIASASLAYHGYEGIALNEDERPRLVANLGDKTSMILVNHGLLTVGETIPDAFLAMYELQSACEIQVAALAGGGELVAIPQGVVAGIGAQSEQVTLGLGGALAWPGLLRKLDRLDSSFRE